MTAASEPLDYEDDQLDDVELEPEPPWDTWAEFRGER